MGLKLNPITGQLDIAGGGSAAPSSALRYSSLFNNTTDWSLSLPDYNLTVLEATHAKGLTPNVQVYEDIGGGSYEMINTNILINSSGDITISVAASPDNRFNGAILII